jgi:hypothetical protein
MSFFNADFPQTTLSSVWEVRSKELRAQQLQPHNDILFDMLRDHILQRRPELYAYLMRVASTCDSVQGLSIPLWSYNAAHYVKPYRAAPGSPEIERTATMLRRKGYRWSVGLVSPDFNPDAVSLTSEEDWNDIWRWRIPQSVDEVVRTTDILSRIALLFGDDHFRVSLCRAAQKVVDIPLSVVVETMEIRLHYHPRGVYPSVRDALRTTQDKYETYEPGGLGVLRPFIWTGLVERPTAVSPPPHPSPNGPPPLVRRSNIARTLSFEQDTVIDDDEGSPCYCGHHHPE